MGGLMMIASEAIAVAIAVLWVVGWLWRIRHGLLDDATSRGQVIALGALVASVPVFALILLISL